jgi:hypothetical protein
MFLTFQPGTPHHDNHQGLDYLIANSGLIGRAILKCGKLLYGLHDRAQPEQASGPRVSRSLQVKITHSMGLLILNVFSYYVGGSLTRADQHTLARLNGLGIERAHRLTLINALVFGIPTALYYFLLGQGFHWLGGVHDMAMLPSWVAQHSAQLIGLTSLGVDLFRAIDAAWHRRCWAPFGLFPLLINLPTYFKKIVNRILQNCGPDRSWPPD